MEKRGRGRPPIENPKSRQLNIRMLPEDRKKLELLAEWKGVTKAELLLRLLRQAWRNR